MNDDVRQIKLHRIVAYVFGWNDLANVDGDELVVQFDNIEDVDMLVDTITTVIIPDMGDDHPLNNCNTDIEFCRKRFASIPLVR